MLENLVKFEELSEEKQKELFLKSSKLKELAFNNAIESIDFFIEDKLKELGDSLKNYELGTFIRQIAEFKREYVLDNVKKCITNYGASEDIENKIKQLDAEYNNLNKEDEEKLEKWLDKQEELLEQFAKEELMADYVYLENLSEEEFYQEYFCEQFENFLPLDYLFYNKEKDKLFMLESVK